MTVSLQLLVSVPGGACVGRDFSKASVEKIQLPGQEGLRGPLEFGILDRLLQRWWQLRALPFWLFLAYFVLCPCLQGKIAT